MRHVVTSNNIRGVILSQSCSFYQASRLFIYLSSSIFIVHYLFLLHKCLSLKWFSWNQWNIFLFTVSWWYLCVPLESGVYTEVRYRCEHPAPLLTSVPTVVTHRGVPALVTPEHTSNSRQSSGRTRPIVSDLGSVSYIVSHVCIFFLIVVKGKSSQTPNLKWLDWRLH